MINFIVCGLENTLLQDGKSEISEEIIELISELGEKALSLLLPQEKIMMQ